LGCAVSFHLTHRLEERFFQIYVVQPRQDKDGPEAVGEFMRELLSTSGIARTPSLRRHQLHQVADIAGEPDCYFLPRPRAAVILLLQCGVLLAHIPGTLC
jgi:hypothetical protein